jgi:hypothetical protein
MRSFFSRKLAVNDLNEEVSDLLTLDYRIYQYFIS